MLDKVPHHYSLTDDRKPSLNFWGQTDPKESL